MPVTKTREQWLMQATRALTPAFTRAGATLPPVRVSVGWPAGRSAKGNTIGQCFQAPLVKDGQPAIFISPALDEPVLILATLVHELVHASVPVSSQPHRGPFVKLAKSLGLEGPWTATGPGPELRADLKLLAAKLGPLDHSIVSKGSGRPKPQDTRMLKVVCPEDGYLVRTTAKWLTVGFPSCPEGHEMALPDA